MEKLLILNHLSGLKKTQILTYLDSAWEEMTEKQQRSVFGKLNKELTAKTLNTQDHAVEVELFYKASLNGRYYAPFNINSKNYMHVPDETDKWFDKISILLDATCELAQKGEKKTALEAFKQLIDLIDRMENAEEIVFADELGDWMITSKHDYQKVYQGLKS